MKFSYICQIFFNLRKEGTSPHIINPSAHLSTIAPSRHSLPNRIWLGLDGLASSPSPAPPPFPSSLGRSLAPHPTWRRMDQSPVSRIRIRDPVPTSALDPGSGMGKKSRYGSGMNIPDHISKSLETIFFG